MKPSDGAAERDDATHTSDEPTPPSGPSLPAPPPQRLVAPLQYRDPERYDVLGEHGRGGLGTVSRAHDKELGRPVAIKELLVRDERGEIRFLREALITARLEHPGIVPIHEAGRWPDGTPFYVMKLVAGRSLKDMIAERATIEDRLGLLHHVLAVADAVAYAHKRKIIHRDLKPANVIAGDFGETIVIDWGLAKDLSAADEPTADPTPYRATASDDLTVTGSILGTPMYMAPEQSRGEPVDQRADVFAIGAMLWELCSLQRVPPQDARQRDRMLRRAGIDKDLAAIIAKALAPNTKHRYRDAGELASDLKAFKSGVRIAARRYSLLAMLAHWTSRHRALATTIATALVLSIAGTILFIRNIAVERDRADGALVKAEAEQQRAKTANDELVLQNAELLLGRDPTSALAALANYSGGDGVRHKRLIAEAKGRGVAHAELVSHADTVWFIAGDPSGDIVSIGEDLRINLTQKNTSTTLARDVSPRGVFDYSPVRRWVAYAASPSGVNVLDLVSRTTTKLPVDNSQSIAILFDGLRIATLNDHGSLTIWRLHHSIAYAEYQTLIPGATQLLLLGSSALVIRGDEFIRVLPLNHGYLNVMRSIGIRSRSLSTGTNTIAVGDFDGSIVLLSDVPVRIARLAVCHQAVNSVSIMPDSNRIAFACNEGTAGVAQYVDGKLSVVDVLATNDRALEVLASSNGRYVIISDHTTSVHVYDVVTRIFTRFEGQSARIVTIAAPSPGFDFFMTGDGRGTIRIWNLPSAQARVAARSTKPIFGLATSPNKRIIAAGGVDRFVHHIDLDSNRSMELHGHEGMIHRVRFAPDGCSLVSNGSDGTARSWNAANGAMMRVVRHGHSAIKAIGYIEEGRRIVSIGDDGLLLTWTPDGKDVTTLLTHSSPLANLETLRYNDHVVVSDIFGAALDIAPNGNSRQFRNPDGEAVTVLRASRNGRLVAIGTSSGKVTVYRTIDWHVVTTVDVDGSVRRIAFDPEHRDILVASENGNLRVVPLDDSRDLPWRNIRMMIHDVDYSPNGDIVAVATEHGLWMYAIRYDKWIFRRDHHTDIYELSFSSDGTKLVTVDRRSVVIVYDSVNGLFNDERKQ